MTYTTNEVVIESLTNNSLYVPLYAGRYFLYIKGSGNALKTQYRNNNVQKEWKATSTKHLGWQGTFKITKETTGHFFSANTTDMSYFDILVKPTVSTDFTALENALHEVTNADLKTIADIQGEYSVVDSSMTEYLSERLGITREEVTSLLSEYSYSLGKYIRLILAGRDMYDYFSTNLQKTNISKSWISNLFYTNYNAINTTTLTPSNIPQDTGFIYLKYLGS